jgi:hypothetical protein
MDAIFNQWRKDVIPVNLSLDENGKKVARPHKWKNGETYKNINTNSVGLRTGSKTVNVVDVDTKDLTLLVEPFKSWVEDRLMFGDTLVVESANGYHFYFYSDVKVRTTTKTGANKSTVPYIDFRGEGGLIFIHSIVDGISYDVLSDSEPIKMDEMMSAFLPEYQEAVIEDEDEGFENLDDETDTGKTVVTEYGGLKSSYEVQELLEPLSSACNRDTWMQLLASAYNLAEDKKDIKEVCQAWSEKADNYDDAGFELVWRQLENGTYGKPFKGGMLIKMSNEKREKEKERLTRDKFNKYKDRVKQAMTIDEINEVFDEEWKSAPICTEAQQKALPAICKSPANELRS